MQTFLAETKHGICHKGCLKQGGLVSLQCTPFVGLPMVGLFAPYLSIVVFSWLRNYYNDVNMHWSPLIWMVWISYSVWMGMKWFAVYLQEPRDRNTMDSITCDIGIIWIFIYTLFRGKKDIFLKEKVAAEYIQAFEWLSPCCQVNSVYMAYIIKLNNRATKHCFQHVKFSYTVITSLLWDNKQMQIWSYVYTRFYLSWCYPVCVLYFSPWSLFIHTTHHKSWISQMFTQLISTVHASSQRRSASPFFLSKQGMYPSSYLTQSSSQIIVIITKQISLFWCQI